MMHKERRETSKIGWRYGLIGLLIAATLAFVMHRVVLQQGYTAVVERAQLEAGLVVELTTGFVRTYSAYQSRYGDHSLPTPASYRADALSHLKESGRIDGHVSTGVVGLPGREIAVKATDSLMRRQLNEMAVSPDVSVLSSVTERNNQKEYRSLWPFIASEQGCADCHNRIQNLSDADKWRVGDLMGAQIVEKNIEPQLQKVRQAAHVQAFLLFVAVLGFWFCCLYLANHFKLTRELKVLAATDPLTGCINRREFQKVISKLQGATDGALLMLDLDKFKQINDLYGHEAGDQVLRDFVQRTRGNLRADDLVARFGGEEFVIWLPGIKAVHAIRLAERLRADVEKSEVIYDDATIQYTVSIGLQIVHNAVPSRFEQWINAADGLVYRAKSEGRNRVVAGDELPA